MLDLAKAHLPDTVDVLGKAYKIQTSFRYWIQFSRLIADKNTPLSAFHFMFPYEKPPSILEGVKALVEFYNPPQELPKSDDGGNGERVLDYDIDAPLIYAAFLQQYGIDLFEGDLHWHKFLVCLRGLQGTKLNEIISYRLYVNTSGRHDGYTREMEKLKRAWALPQEIDDEALEEFNALFD